MLRLTMEKILCLFELVVNYFSLVWRYIMLGRSMAQRKHKEKKGEAGDNGGSGKRRTGAYSEDTIAAVKYLVGKGITRSSEIARRLDISPFTANNIKRILRERGLIEPSKRAESKEPKGIIRILTKRKRGSATRFIRR